MKIPHETDYTAFKILGVATVVIMGFGFLSRLHMQQRDAAEESQRAANASQYKPKPIEVYQPRQPSTSAIASSSPLTVTGTLGCEPPGAVTFTANGKTYAVNSTATAKGYADITPIWRDDPQNSKFGLKLSLSPLVADGLKLCK